jgi:hypothetical protein
LLLMAVFLVFEVRAMGAFEPPIQLLSTNDQVDFFYRLDEPTNKEDSPSPGSTNTEVREYDQHFEKAIQHRWDDLVVQLNDADYEAGRVVLRFQLHADGTVSDMKELENTVTGSLGLLCEKSILDPAPFEPWPTNMLSVIQTNSRSLTYTFFYHDSDLAGLPAPHSTVRLSVFRKYESHFASMVDAKWRRLMDADDGRAAGGRVVIRLRLNAYGYVTEAAVEENTAGEQYGPFCRKAIMQSASYGRWTHSMRKKNGTPSLEIRAVFHYD